VLRSVFVGCLTGLPFYRDKVVGVFLCVFVRATIAH
jgi:hypothetical protein